jgi:hypothetical protein
MRLQDNIKGAWERARAMGPVDLVTADGSIDCSGSPNEQEEIVAQLHFCEVTPLLPSACIPLAGKRRELLFCGFESTF